MSTTGHVVFSHGLDGSPFSTKIRALYEIARARVSRLQRSDYRGITDPDERVQMLSDFCRDFLRPPRAGRFEPRRVRFAGRCAHPACPRGFLMAPALYMPGIPALRRGVPSCPIALVHGWRDEVIPCEQSMRFARENKLSLHLVESDHRLHSAIPFLRYLFQYFLVESRRAQYVT
jgi:pimeloyl-ACP methyl ester carboxylesterase